MLELLLCSMFTLLPDYLIRRYGQGKRFGHEINFYTVWYELRYGITTCLMLTVALIATVFYNHPSTTNVTSYFRTISILPEAGGRVAEVHVGFSADVEKGQPLFTLDSARQKAALETAIRRIAQVDAAMLVARSDLLAAESQIQEAISAHKQAVDELETKQELYRRNPNTVATRELEKLQNVVDERAAKVKTTEANKQSIETKLSTSLPAEKATAEAAREQAQVDLDKTVVRAGVTGRVEQFTLRPGDFVTPIMRPAGLLIPAGAGRSVVVAGFGQVEAQVMQPGMIAELTCISKPWTIIPMVVTGVQDYISAGQVRAAEQLLDPQQTVRPGTVTTFIEPLYKGGMDDVNPGSTCIANAYSDHHDELARKDIGFGLWLWYHIVDAVALVHALILRLQAAVLPIKLLVFSGH